MATPLRGGQDGFGEQPSMESLRYGFWEPHRLRASETTQDTDPKSTGGPSPAQHSRPLCRGMNWTIISTNTESLCCSEENFTTTILGGKAIEVQVPF